MLGVIFNTSIFIHYFTFFIMKNFDFATATRLDLEIWDTQEKIKYIKLPTRKAQKCHTWATITKK